VLKKAILRQAEQIRDAESNLGNDRIPRADRRGVTAGAIVCKFAAGDYDSDHVKQWLTYCGRTLSIRIDGDGLLGGEFTQFYWAQVVFALGDKGHEKLLPDAKEPLRWSDYRAKVFFSMIKMQKEDGSWDGGWSNPIYRTAAYLTILQMENEAVPIFAARMPGER
jgi:hypothetical protein